MPRFESGLHGTHYEVSIWAIEKIYEANSQSESHRAWSEGVGSYPDGRHKCHVEQ